MEKVRVERWVFTINNYTEADLNALRNVRSPVLVVYGREKGEMGTPHLQGYVQHMEGLRMRRSQVERLLGGRAWIVAAKGDEFQALGYCLKQGMWDCNLVETEKEIEMKSFIQKHIDLDDKCTQWLGTAFWNAFYSSLEVLKEWNTEENVEHLYDVHVHCCCEKCKCKKDFCKSCTFMS